MGRRILVLTFTLLWAGFALAEEGLLSLADAEQAALETSLRLKSAGHRVEAARWAQAAQRSLLAPSLFLKGSYRYLAELPKFSANPAAPAVEMGDHDNYSVGVSADWMLWDFGVVRRTAASLSGQWTARLFDQKALALNTRRAVRQAYLKALGQAEGLELRADALRLAQSEEGDVRQRAQAGAASRQDALQAHVEVLTRQRDLRRAQSDWAETLRDLFSLLHSESTEDLSRPLSRRVAQNLPSDVPRPTYTLALEEPEVLLKRFSPAETADFNPRRPDILALLSEAESHQQAALAAQASRGPQVRASAGVDREYPNGPVRETIHQKMLGVAAQWPLFEGGRPARTQKKEEALAQAATVEADQGRDDLWRDFQKARERYAGLLEVRTWDLQAVDQRGQLAGLVYASYQAGQSSFLEVQAANLGLLEARLAASQTLVESLQLLALLDSLSAKEDTLP